MPNWPPRRLSQQNQLPFVGRIPAQNLLPKARANPGCRISCLANSGTRIRCHPNWKILASESDGIPMGKFWHQNQTASQWANSGSRNQMAFLAAKSDGIPMGKFWHQNLLEHLLELLVLGLLPPPLILSS